MRIPAQIDALPPAADEDELGQRFANAHAGDKPGPRVKILSNGQKLLPDVPQPIPPSEGELPCRIGQVRLGVPSLGPEGIDCEIGKKPKIPIQTNRSIGLAFQVGSLVDKHETDIGIRKNVSTHASHRVLMGGLLGRHFLFLNEQEPKVVRAGLAAETASAKNRFWRTRFRESDAPGKEQDHVIGGRRASPASHAKTSEPKILEAATRSAKPKEAAILQEKRSLFRKKETESRQVDLLRFGLHLREVGIVSEIQRQRRGHAILGVHPPLDVQVILKVLCRVGRALASRVYFSQKVGGHLEVTSGLDILHSDQRARQ